jgi:DNA end-binding protein Ku
MRSIWKGAIAFGLVNVPVKVYSATEDHDVHLHQVHDKDGGRIKYQRRCEICGKIIDFEHIDKAFDEDGTTVVLTEKDLQQLPEERSREISVVEFVPSDQLDPIMFDRSYFLEPDGASTKAYVLLRRTLEATERTAIVHFALRQKTRLGALRVRGDVLVLQSLLWDDEVREASFPALDESVRVSAKELEMSSALVDSFATDFSPEKFTDDYQEQLRQLIEAKLRKGESVSTEVTFGEPEPDGEGGEVLDLMTALKQSVERNRAATEHPPAKTGGRKRAGTPTRERSA